MKNGLNEISACEVCNNKSLIPALNLGLHPMCDDLIPVGDTRECNEYPVEILFCNNCLTAHQRYQVPKKELFPTSYHYRSRFTADVISGMAELVESCEQRFGNLEGKKIFDIGCNDGSLLDIFRKKGAITLGIEPTGAYCDAEQKGHIIYNNFLSEDISKAIVLEQGYPDFITFTNVFAHIKNLKELLNSLKTLMAPLTIIVIENHYLGAVLSGNQFDTFYHEHPRTYSYTSFVQMACSIEVQLLDVEFPLRYGGNIRVFLGNNNDMSGGRTTNLNELSICEKHFSENFKVLQNNMELWRNSKKLFIQRQVQKYGKLKAKAFPGRSAILIKLLGLNEKEISAVYEKPGSLKIGHYVPGTRIPILSDEEFFDLQDNMKPLLNLAWHIPEEIHSYMRKQGYSGPIIDILSLRDFES